MQGGRYDDAEQRLRELRVEAAMQGILSYLRLHPNSADSLRGVRVWLRILPEELGDDIVSTALDQLMQRGEIEAREIGEGTIVYGRRRGGCD